MAFPLIGVTACVRKNNEQTTHLAGEEYLRAVVEGAGGLPVIIPSLGDQPVADAWLENLDGILLTGSPSNVDPALYGQTPHELNTFSDRQRDATTLPLIRAALRAELPLLAICRGFQELNVAAGGSLHQAVHLTGRYQDHRDDPALPLEQQYALAHDITVCPGGLLSTLNLPPVFQVNSLHTQGIDRLADTLQPEARADDGLLEAVSLRGARHFALGVQFHPEWQVTRDEHFLTIFQAFGDACRAYRQQRRG